MANTYTQIYIHIVFAVQGRQNLLRHEYNDELQKYMTGIISGQGQKLDFAPTEHVSGPVKRPNSRGVACNAVARQTEKGLNRNRRQCREGTASSSPPGPLEICKRS